MAELGFYTVGNTKEWLGLRGPAAAACNRRAGSGRTLRVLQVNGFTLLELMFAIAVLGVLLAIGVPSFVTLTQNNRVATQTNELVSALNLARSEAIRRGAPTTVEAVELASGFAGGWCVHVGAGDCNDADDLLRVYPAMTRMTVASDATTITFDARGARQAPTNPRLEITLTPEECASGTANRARQLDIALTGRIALQRVDCP